MDVLQKAITALKNPRREVWIALGFLLGVALTLITINNLGSNPRHQLLTLIGNRQVTNAINKAFRSSARGPTSAKSDILPLESPSSPILFPTVAHWCQCVEFAMNYYGVSSGGYPTAASLVVPDSNGYAWMDYAGFGRRPQGEIPQPQDYIVFKENAAFQYSNRGPGIVDLTWSWGNADASAGHIGIVQEASSYSPDYWLIILRSANWAFPGTSFEFESAGCTNVRLHEILVAKSSQDISFWFEW